MKVSGGVKALRVFDVIVDMFVFATLLTLLIVGGYCVWDNRNIEALASSSEWAVYKPHGDGIESFEKLKRLNPDVVGWLDVYGTSIDYPMLYSEEPDEYLMKDPMGNFSLTGSIFLDSACSPDFSDLETIVYGHHMDREIMFGPIDDFDKRDFFDSHRYGKITLRDGKEYGIEIWALLSGDAYDRNLYKRGITDIKQEQEYLDYLLSRAIYVREDMSVTATDKIVLLSTCAGETTNGRKLLVAKMTDDVMENPFLDDPTYGTGLDVAHWTIFGVPWYVIGAVAAVLIVIGIVLYLRFANKRKERMSGVAKRLGVEDAWLGLPPLKPKESNPGKNDNSGVDKPKDKGTKS